MYIFRSLFVYTLQLREVIPWTRGSSLSKIKHKPDTSATSTVTWTFHPFNADNTKVMMYSSHWNLYQSSVSILTGRGLYANTLIVIHVYGYDVDVLDWEKESPYPSVSIHIWLHVSIQVYPYVHVRAYMHVYEHFGTYPYIHT